MGIQLTIWVHPHFIALFQPTCLALVPSCQVDDTIAFVLALVLQTPSNASLEETSATVACQHPVMFARRAIPADFTNRKNLAVYRLKDEGKLTWRKQTFSCKRVKYRIHYCFSKR